MIGMLLFSAALVLKLLQRGKKANARGAKLPLLFSVSAVIWLWFWGCNVTTRFLGYPLEKNFPPMLAKSLPEADAAIVLGGGIRAGGKGKIIYPEMHMGADRAWHAARIYKAGRVPYVVTTGTGSSQSDRKLLLALGVPDNAIIQENTARNTEEHVALVKEALGKKYSSKKGPFKVLVVTSAWHMRRTLLNFAQSDLEVIPAPADHECTMCASGSLRFVHFFPDAESFLLNSYIFKEYLGYWLYRIKFAVKLPG
ncbi:MAG: YdcF family protein [Kiritimatiellia bacterium]